jgi:hypothetical protein
VVSNNSRNPRAWSRVARRMYEQCRNNDARTFRKDLDLLTVCGGHAGAGRS